MGEPASAGSLAIYETLLTRAGKLVAAEEHFQRLFDSARTAGLTAPRMDDVLREVSDLLATHEPEASDGRLRLVWDGSRLETAWESVPAKFDPARVTWSRYQRISSNPLNQAKIWQQSENVMAAQESQALGVDETILLNQHGRVAEGWKSSIFFVIDGVAYTPPLSEGVLPGTVRNWLLLNEPRTVQEQTLSAADLTAASEVFLTSAIRLVQPIREFAGQAFTISGPVSSALLARLAHRRSQ